jgi:hypothetical protein
MTALLTSKQPKLELEPLAVGNLVYVICYGPYWGLRGVIHSIDAIASAGEDLYFYLVTLQEGQMREPLWLVHDDIAPVEGDNVSLRHKGYP